MIPDLRQTAADSFATLGYPTTRDEEWRFTNVAPLAKLSFDRPPGPVDASELIARFPADHHRLIFVNGRHTLWGRAMPCPDKTIITTLRDSSRNPEIDRHLARYADYHKHAFVALNTASFDDGAFVYVPPGVIVERPIHLIYISIAGDRPHATHPRNLVVLGPRSQASVIESYVGVGQYFTNAVTEIAAGEGAIVAHHKLQQESHSAFHIATLQTQQERGCAFQSHSISFGGALVRNDVNSVLAEGAECTLNGLYVVNGHRHVDTHTAIDHARPHASSHELYKGILNGESSAVFNGKIIVRPDAQKTDARQTNKNLVLSENATINTKPELQIFADDVRCTHGATVGQLDDEAIFYLQSRGIPRQVAREMLTRAFAREIVDGIRHDWLRTYVEDLLR